MPAKSQALRCRFVGVDCSMWPLFVGAGKTHSGALRLRAHGLEVSSGFRRGYPYDDWFLRTPSDVRSGASLEVVASEFERQGLEVDWAGVCWGDDVVFNAHDKNWDTRKFIGARWLTITNPIGRKLAPAGLSRFALPGRSRLAAPPGTPFHLSSPSSSGSVAFRLSCRKKAALFGALTLSNFRGVLPRS